MINKLIKIINATHFKMLPNYDTYLFNNYQLRKTHVHKTVQHLARVSNQSYPIRLMMTSFLSGTSFRRIIFATAVAVCLDCP